MAFELLGVKAVRAFDATVVIVSLAVQGDGTRPPGGGLLPHRERRPPRRGTRRAQCNQSHPRQPPLHALGRRAALARLSSPRLPRFAYPNAPRTGSRASPVRATVPPLFRSDVMPRFVLLLAPVRARRSPAAATGAARDPAAAPRAQLPPAPTRVRAAPALAGRARCCCRPRPRSIRSCPPEELAAELRIAADSAADEAVLEALDEAAPRGRRRRGAAARRRRSAGTSTSTPTPATIASSTTSTSSRARAASAWASGSRACRATRG